MLNPRLYRAALVPFVLALALAAFSLGSRPLPATSTLTTDAFSGARATEQWRYLAAAYPRRRPGSAGDLALADHVSAVFRALGGFSVRSDWFEAQTIDGPQQLRTVIAERPGSTAASPIVLVAHRDAAGRGAAGELSATAALLELARVFAERQTKRPIVLVSTTGGSGGDAGAQRLPAVLGGPLDAAIVIGDLAGRSLSRPLVVPYSDGYGSAPLELERTVADAITRQTGSDPGSPSTLGQLVHLTFPLAVGEQGVLNAGGLPAVLVQTSGERPPARREALSGERLEGLGRGVLGAVDALDGAPDVPASPQAGIALQHKLLPAWVVRLLTAMLLLAPLITAVDALARLRRRRMPVGRWTLWTLGCGLPFLSCALFAYLLGRLGVLGAAPALPGSAQAMPFTATTATVLVAMALTFTLAWMLWRMLLRRLRWERRPDPDVAGVPVLLVLLAVCAIAWVGDPYTALLLLPALHLWLLLADPALRPRRPLALGLVALALAPLALTVLFYAHQLGLGLGATAWTAVLLLAGGHVGLGGALLWSVALGCLAAAAMLALSEPDAPALGDGGRPIEITIRGPLGYAGPGSLGGTESALRR